MTNQVGEILGLQYEAWDAQLDKLKTLQSNYDRISAELEDLKRLGFWSRVRCLFTGVRKARPAPKTRREIKEQARTTANRPSTKRG
jgi:hypothetical protein